MDRKLELRPLYKYIWIITKLFNLKYFTHEHKIKQKKKNKKEQTTKLSSFYLGSEYKIKELSSKNT